MVDLKDKMKRIGTVRRRKVEARAAELLAEEMTLRDLRRAHEMTQGDVADQLGIGQESISRLEKRSDLLISTLRGYVEAMGGRLRILAEFPDRPPVSLSGLADFSPPPQKRSRGNARGRSAGRD